MIEASFEQATHKSAAIGGIYQYDTGQRLRMHLKSSSKTCCFPDRGLAGPTRKHQNFYPKDFLFEN